MARKKQLGLGILDNLRSLSRRAPKPSVFKAEKALKISQKGKEKRGALISNRVNKLAKILRLPRDATTRGRVIKEIAI